MIITIVSMVIIIINVLIIMFVIVTILITVHHSGFMALFVLLSPCCYVPIHMDERDSGAFTTIIVGGIHPGWYLLCVCDIRLTSYC